MNRIKQVGGSHYCKYNIQVWDIVLEYNLSFFEGSALAYLLRRKNNRIEDLQKCAHYIEKCIEIETAKAAKHEHEPHTVTTP